jgi:hypothetical protein
MNQEQLNNCIAEELNKWQPILEYARIYIDEAKDFRKNHLWANCWKPTLLIEGLGTVICAIISKIEDLSVLCYIGIFLFLLLCITAFVCYKYRKKLVSKDEIEKLCNLSVNLNKYIIRLQTWLVSLDNRKKVTKAEVDCIEKEYRQAVVSMADVEEQFSNIHGNIIPEWQKRAKEYAAKRLEPYKQYI